MACMEDFNPVTRMKSGDALIQAWNLMTKPHEKCCRIFHFYRFYILKTLILYLHLYY